MRQVPPRVHAPGEQRGPAPGTSAVAQRSAADPAARRAARLHRLPTQQPRPRRGSPRCCVAAPGRCAHTGGPSACSRACRCGRERGAYLRIVKPKTYRFCLSRLSVSYCSVLGLMFLLSYSIIFQALLLHYEGRRRRGGCGQTGRGGRSARRQACGSPVHACEAVTDPQCPGVCSCAGCCEGAGRGGR